MIVTHLTDPEMFSPDEEGWFTGRCSCGWTFGPAPDIEVAVDALVEHVFREGFTAGRQTLPEGIG